MEYYLTIKTNEIMPFAATWVDLRIIMLTELSQTKQISSDITYMWNLEKKYDTNELICKTDSQTRKTNSPLPKRKRWRGGIYLEVGINTYTLICIK